MLAILFRVITIVKVLFDLRDKYKYLVAFWKMLKSYYKAIKNKKQKKPKDELDS